MFENARAMATGYCSWRLYPERSITHASARGLFRRLELETRRAESDMTLSAGCEELCSEGRNDKRKHSDVNVFLFAHGSATNAELRPQHDRRAAPSVANVLRGSSSTGINLRGDDLSTVDEMVDVARRELGVWNVVDDVVDA
jgi:hypothetical protein